MDDCVSSPCLNGGMCSTVTNNDCTCSPGHSVKRCGSYITATSTNNLLSTPSSTSAPAQVPLSFTVAFSTGTTLNIVETTRSLNGGINKACRCLLSLNIKLAISSSSKVLSHTCVCTCNCGVLLIWCNPRYKHSLWIALYSISPNYVAQNMCLWLSVYGFEDLAAYSRSLFWLLCFSLFAFFSSFFLQMFQLH